MAHVNKEGEIILEQEERQSLNEGLGKDWAKNIINHIIWGQKKNPYESNGKIQN